MGDAEQWYYLDKSQARGPLSSAELIQQIKGGSLSPATQIAQSGWAKWLPASEALANLLARSPAVQNRADPSREQPAYAIKVHCISEPDAGKAYIIGASESSLGRASGVGQNDPQVAAESRHPEMAGQRAALPYARRIEAESRWHRDYAGRAVQWSELRAGRVHLASRHCAGGTHQLASISSGAFE